MIIPFLKNGRFGQSYGRQVNKNVQTISYNECRLRCYAFLEKTKHVILYLWYYLTRKKTANRMKILILWQYKKL